MRRRGAWALLLTALAVSGCAAQGTDKPKAAPIRLNPDPYPSTYHPYPGAVTVIRGATVFDGEGGRIDNGTVVLADGVVQAVGGSDVPSPDGA